MRGDCRRSEQRAFDTSQNPFHTGRLHGGAVGRPSRVFRNRAKVVPVGGYRARVAAKAAYGRWSGLAPWILLLSPWRASTSCCGAAAAVPMPAEGSHAGNRASSVPLIEKRQADFPALSSIQVLTECRAAGGTGGLLAVHGRGTAGAPSRGARVEGAVRERARCAAAVRSAQAHSTRRADHAAAPCRPPVSLAPAQAARAAHHGGGDTGEYVASSTHVFRKRAMVVPVGGYRARRYREVIPVGTDGAPPQLLWPRCRVLVRMSNR